MDLDAVRAVFGEVLDRNDVAPDDDFFVLGGDSLQAGRLAARIRAETGTRIRLADFLDDPTPVHVHHLVVAHEAGA